MIDETAQPLPLPGLDKARIQADWGFAMRRLRRAADRRMEVAGPGAFAASRPLQRLWRDLSLGTRHTTLNALPGNELHGRASLRLDSKRTLPADIRPTA